jgi:lathosterol oxidase
MTVYEFFTRWESAYIKIGSRYFIMAAVAFFLFYVVFKNKMLARKIQAKFPKMKDYGRDIFYSIISIGIFAGITVFTFTVLKPYSNLYDDINQYGIVYYCFTYVWMFFLHDAYFYWSHRLMHHPKIFKYVHLIHHKSTNPTPWTSYAFHPFEAVLEALIVPIIAFSIPTMRSAIITYSVFQIIYNVYGHLGFELFPKKINKHWLGKYLNTSVSHNMHHKYFVKNYGLWTSIWDRMMGTLNERYDEAYKQATESSIITATEQQPA